jgi:outer membrane protein assembly factor BamB
MNSQPHKRKARFAGNSLTQGNDMPDALHECIKSTVFLRSKLMKNRTLLLKSFLIAGTVTCLLFAALNQGCSPKTPAGQADYILEKSGVKGGLIVHINCGNGVLTEALKANNSYLVQGLDANVENINKARQYIASKGDYGPVSVDRLAGNRLPYEDNLINLVVAEDLGSIPMDEVMRVLAPNGVAMTKRLIGWKITMKPRPAGMDEWNQYLYSSAGNMVSKDEIIGPVKHYQWIGSPRWGRHHDTTASMSAMVSANGRIFYILDEGPRESIELPSKNSLIARDAFNGTILWKRPIAEWEDHLFALKSGPAYLPRRLVAVGDRVFVTLGINAPLSELDAATGETIRTFEKTEQASEVIFSENTLFLVVGRPEKTKEHFAPDPKDTYVWDNADRARSEWAWGRQPAQIKAINADKGNVLWEKTYPVAPLSLSADSKAVYFYDGAQLVCINRLNGRENWKSEAIKTKAIDTAYAPRMVVYEDVVLFSSGVGRMIALSAADGRKLWDAAQPPSGHYSPEDIFVIGGLVWTGATAWTQANGTYTGLDLHTGEVKSEVPCDTNIYFFHQRCYPSKATEKYILPSRTGIEFVDLDKKHWTVNHYTRGGCIYGIMPSNGLIYTPPHACACYMEAKLNGLGALGPMRGFEPDLAAASGENRLEKGPAYDKEISNEAHSEDWPTYRHDALRSGYTPSQVPSELKPEWRVKLEGKLSSPVIAGNRMFLAKVDAHTVYAIDTTTGENLWNYSAGGRVDSPPTVYQGRVLFGSADGYVYCLNAADGALIWRFRAAPMDRRLVAFEQVESVWPVHGSVLIQDDKVYCAAGRSMFLDGGLRLLQLNPRTGEKLSEAILDDRDPETGKNLQQYVQGLDMPVGLPDILSSDGQYLYMRSQQFDLEGNRKHIGVRDVTDQSGEGAHVFSPIGFLDDSQFSRSYMMYGKSVKSGWGGWEVMAKLTPSGRLIAVDGNTVYGYGRKPEFLAESIVLEYQLYAAAKAGDPRSIKLITQPAKGPVNPFDKSMMNYAGDWKLRQGLPKAEQSAVEFKWLVDKPPLQVRAMVLADKTLFIAGPPDVVDEENAFFALSNSDVLEKLAEQSAMLEGKNGAIMWAVSAANGKKLAEYKLDSLPVWDGMVAANGKLYMTTMKGEVLSFAGKGN